MPLYIGEVSPKQFRGALSSFYQLAIDLGIVAAFWINVGLETVDLGWRISVWVQLVPCIILVRDKRPHIEHEYEYQCQMRQMPK